MQIFENKGAAMGCSNPHPHGQVWTTTGMPEEPGLELEQLQKYRREQGGANLLEDYVQLEMDKRERIVFENATFLAVCPWWATWPFETMVVCKRRARALVDLTQQEKEGLAEAIAEVTRRYDNLFETHFPYSESLLFEQVQKLMSTPKAWVCTRRRLTARMKRSKRATFICTSIRRC
jgi:UDPglucose--hexose-1-phosphate uridylyltransferase